MKTKLSKRLLSIVLALLMVITAMPFTAITASADEIESIVWKYDAAQAGQKDPITSQTDLLDRASVSGKTSTVTVVPNGSGSYNDTAKVITHIENGYAYGTINDVPADCNHWKLTFRFAYTGNQNSGSVPVFAIGRSSSSVLIKVMSNGDYYISGTKIGTIANPSALNCASVDDIKTASFEYNNGTLSFNIAGNVQFTESNPTYVINATSHFVGGLKYFATGDSANQIKGMNISKIIAAPNKNDDISIETKSGTLNQNGYQILCNGTEGRWSDNQWNIVNDQEANNTSAGVVRIPLADVKGMQVNSATFKMTVDNASGDSECNGLDVYWSTDYAKINGYIAGGQTNSVGCASGDGTTANDSFATKLGFSRTGSLVATYPKSTTGEQSFDIKSVMQSIVDTNADYLYLIVMQKNAGGKGSGSGWSDTKVKPTLLSITYNVQNKIMAKSEVQTKLEAYSFSTFTNDYASFSNGNNWGNEQGTLSGTDADKYKYFMKNVLYGQKNTVNATSTAKINSITASVSSPTMVFVYDGTTELKTPIITYSKADAKDKTLYSANINNDELSIVDTDYWYGTDTQNNWAWLYTNKKKNSIGRLGVTTNGDSPTPKDESGDKCYKNTFYWANMFKFKNSTKWGDSYYLEISPEIQFKAQNFDNKIVSPNKVYYLNYKKIIDQVATAKSDLNSLDPTQYTVASVKDYYDAIIALVSYDIKSAGSKISSSDVAAGAKTVADELKALVDNYNTAKAGLQKIHTVTFQYISGDKLTKKVLNGQTCTVPDDDSPAKIEKLDAINHKVTRYYWGPADAKITDDVTYTEKTNVSNEPHAWVKTATTVAPTCTEQGYTVYECSICGETTHKDPVNPTGHSYDTGVIVRKTDGDTGYINGETYNAEKKYEHYRKCGINGDHEKQILDCNIGASWEVRGDKEYSTCSDCGGYVTRPHIVGYSIKFKDVNGKVIADNTTEDGEMPSTPNLLNYAYIDEDGHHSFSWNKEVVVATEATEYQMVENELVAHDYADNYREITAATCYAQGLEADPCTVDRSCTYSKTRPIDKIAHTWGDWEYDEVQQKQYHICTVEECQYKEYGNCTFEITNEVAATCTQRGSITYTCKECGGSYTENPMALGHDLPANWTSLNNGKHQKACQRDGCDYVETQDCITKSVFFESTCSENAKFANHCDTCGYNSSENLWKASIPYSDLTGQTIVNNTYANAVSNQSEVRYQYSSTSMFDIDYVEVELEYKTPNTNNASARIYNDSSNKTGTITAVGNAKAPNSDGEIGGKNTSGSGTYRFTVPDGKLINIVFVLRYSSKGYINIKSMNVVYKVPDGYTTAQLNKKGHKIQKDGNVYKCENCGDVIHTQSDKFRITTGNLFNFDDFTKTNSANTELNTGNGSKGTATYDTVDDTAIIIGDGDTYTNYTGEGLYTIPVTVGDSYTIEYDESTTAGRLLVFAPGAGLTSDVLCDISSNTAGHISRTFEIPAGCSAIHIRYGVNTATSYCAFTNLAIYKNGTFEVLADNIASDTAVTDAIDTTAIEDFCKFNPVIETVTTNLNLEIVNHNWKNDAQIAPTCTEKGREAGKTCTICEATDGYDEIAALGHSTVKKVKEVNGVYTFYTICENDNEQDFCKDYPIDDKVIDVNAYNGFVALAQADIDNTIKYTKDSRDELATYIVELDLTADSEITQGDVDSYADALETAMNLKKDGGVLVLQPYTLTYKTVVNGAEKVVSSDTYNYGEMVELEIPKDAGTAYKWTLDYVGTTETVKLANNTQKVTVVVNQNTNVYAYVNEDKAPVENEVKVVLLDKTSRVSAIAYTTNSSITFSDTTVSVDGNEMHAVQVPFYNVKGFMIDGKVVSGDYAIPEGVSEITIRPVYKAGSTFVINVSEDVTINSQNVTSYNAKWDEPITLTSNTEVIWYDAITGATLGQGDTYKFRANSNITIATKSVAVVDPTASIGYFDYDVELNKVTIVNNFFVPTGKTASAAGVVLSTKTNDIETLKKQTSGRFNVTRFTENGNQTKISVSRTANTAFTMYALAYVVVDGETYYADEVATCNYTPQN